MAAETTVNIAIVLEKNPEAVAEKYIKDYTERRMGPANLANLINAVAAGIETGKIIASVDKADGTQAAITCAITYANVSDGDTVTFCGVVFTAKTGTPSTDPYAGEFKKETDATVTGDNLAAAINAHPALKGLLAAVNAVGTLTLTMTNKGNFGNEAKASTSDATAFGLGGSGLFTAGAIGTVQSAIRCYQGGLA